jgi:hypothetical protein
MKLSELPNHHAILITNAARVSYAETLWKELSLDGPQHRYFNQTVLDIETARTIISWAKDSYNESRVALITFASAGIPAQNAMLKVLEEPNAHTRFVLVTEHSSSLIDTVLSRLRHIPLGGINPYADNASEFLSASPVVRMKLPFITELLSRTDEEGRKDRENIKSFILSLAEALRSSKADARYTMETFETASYASDPSASGKALLEYLALLLPSIK